MAWKCIKYYLSTMTINNKYFVLNDSSSFSRCFFQPNYMQYINTKDTLTVLLSVATNVFSNHYIIWDCLCCTFYYSK